MKVQAPEVKGKEGPGSGRGRQAGQRLSLLFCREVSRLGVGPKYGSHSCEVLSVRPRTSTSSSVGRGERNIGNGDGRDQCFPKVI